MKDRHVSLARRTFALAGIAAVAATLVSFIPPANAKTDTYVDAPSPFLLVGEACARDVRATTRCSGEGCGLAFRIADDGSFSVARFAPGGRVELARVHRRGEDILGVASLPAVDEAAWRRISVEARGDVVRVAVDDARVIDVVDARPARTGRVGLWSSASAAAEFGELVVEPLAPAPQAYELLPLVAGLRRRS